MGYRFDQLKDILDDSESGYVRLKVEGPSTSTKWLTISRSELNAITGILYDGESN